MRKILLVIALIVTALTVHSQQMSETMSKYSEGCFALREAIAQKDFGRLLSAKSKYNNLKLDQYSEEDFSPIDSISQSVILKPTILFTPEFVDTLVSKGIISLEEIDNAVLMRKGDGELFLWHASIAPKSSATFKTEGFSDCEMFLCSTQDSNLKLSIGSNTTGQLVGTPVNDNSAWYINWNLPEDGESFNFTITNNGDSVSTFVIAIN